MQVEVRAAKQNKTNTRGVLNTVREVPGIFRNLIPIIETRTEEGKFVTREGSYKAF